MKPPRIARTTSQLATACGASRRTISAWLKVDGNPGRRADGSFSVTRWQKWIAANGLGSRTAAAERDPTLEPLRREKLRLQTEVLQLQAAAAARENSVARGELFPEREAARVITDSWRAMILQLRQTKHRISSQVCGRDSGSAARLLSTDLAETLRQFQLPEGLRHPFYARVREQLATLHNELLKEGI